MAQLKRPLARLGLVLLGVECGLRLLGLAYRAHYLDRLGMPEDRAVPGAYRILCLGESTTQGAPGPLEESYPFRLQQALERRHPGIRFKVYNRGVSAVNAGDIYGHLRRNLLETRPQLVLYQAGNNGGAIGPVRGISKTWELGALGARLAAAAWRGRVSLQRTFSQDAYLLIQADGQAPADEEITLRYMERTVRQLQEEGVPVILVGYFDSPVGNRLLERVSRDLGAPLRRTDAIYRGYLAKGRAAELLSADGWHPSALGYALMARELLPDVEKSRGFPGR